jgi:RNA polymerase sigma-70 factor, ECF subfamily
MPRPVFGTGGGSAARRAGSVTPLDRDRPLVDAARRDPTRFDALYRRYLARVYSYAYYELRDHHDAEDATERTFLAALSSLPAFEERALRGDDPEASTFRVWLFRIARNVVANQRRLQARHPQVPLDAAAAVVAPTDVETAVTDRDDAAAAWRAVARLPADRRRAVVLRFVEELSTAEIASILGRSEGAVRVLLHRALRTVGRDLREGRDATRPTADRDP